MNNAEKYIPTEIEVEASKILKLLDGKNMVGIEQLLDEVKRQATFCSINVKDEELFQEQKH